MPGEVDTFHLSQKCMFWEEQDPSKTYSSHLSFIKHAQLDKKIALRSSDHTADFNYSEWRDGDDIWKKNQTLHSSILVSEEVLGF